MKYKAKKIYNYSYIKLILNLNIRKKLGKYTCSNNKEYIFRKNLIEQQINYIKIE